MFLGNLVGVDMLFLVFALALFYVPCKWVYNIWFNPLARYPGPLFARASNIPLVWNLIRGTQCIWMKNLHRQYGSVVRCAPNDLSYASAGAWEDIYIAKKMYGQKWAGFYGLNMPQFHNILSADNQNHAELRKIFLPAFSEASLRSWEPMFKDVATQMVEKLTQCAETKKMPVDMGQFFMYVTFDIMGQFTLDTNFGLVNRMEFLDWISGQFDNSKFAVFLIIPGYFTFLKPLVTIFTWIMRTRANVPYNFATEQVTKRMSRPDPEAGSDIWSLIAKGPKSGRKLSKYEMDTHALLLFLAGTETSAAAMTGLMYYLSQYPDIADKLKKEIRSAFKSREEIKLRKVLELPYLQACIEETLRIYPPGKVALPRITPPEGAMIEGRHVPGGVVVYVSNFASNLLPENWKSPEEFIPERWLKGNQEFANDERNARRPFSAGPRNCIGMNFAYHEMRLVISELLYNFDIELCPQSEGWADDQKTWILNDKLPLWMNLKSTREI